MNKIKKNKTIMSLTLFFIILCMIYLGKNFMNNEKKGSAQNNKPSTFQVQAENTAPVSVVPEEEKKNAPIDIPILMYHHIRNMDDPNDQIGTNLSVSPESLAEELDFIKKNGYNTVGFKDLNTNKLPSNPIILTFDDGYDNFYINAYPLLKERGMTGTVFVIVNDLGKTGYLSENNLIELKIGGIEIGSHTLSHPDLTKISETKLISELSDSKNKLEAILNDKVISFCYPSGKHNENVDSTVSKTEYLYAVTTENGKANTKNPMTLKRYRVNKDTNISSFITK